MKKNIDNSKIMRDKVLKRLESNKNYMMKDFNFDDPVLYHDIMSEDEKESDSEENNADSSVDSGSEQDDEEEKSEKGEDSNYSSEDELPVSRKCKKQKGK